jgi:hypothetical protein
MALSFLRSRHPTNSSLSASGVVRRLSLLSRQETYQKQVDEQSQNHSRRESLLQWEDLREDSSRFIELHVLNLRARMQLFGKGRCRSSLSIARIDWIVGAETTDIFFLVIGRIVSIAESASRLTPSDRPRIPGERLSAAPFLCTTRLVSTTFKDRGIELTWWCSQSTSIPISLGV